MKIFTSSKYYWVCILSNRISTVEFSPKDKDNLYMFKTIVIFFTCILYYSPFKIDVVKIGYKHVSMATATQIKITPLAGLPTRRGLTI